jgi:hypothetical protein
VELLIERTAIMIIGETIWAPQGDSQTYYTPWFPRGGDELVGACEVIHALNATVSVTVQTKNSEMTDAVSGSTNVIEDGGHSISVIGPPKTTSFKASGGDWSGALELVRFKITVTPGENDNGLVHLRMLAPSWVTN